MRHIRRPALLLLSVLAGGGANDFGLDAGNAFYADNASLIQIPEPATTAIFSAGAAIALLLRRRRNDPGADAAR